MVVSVQVFGIPAVIAILGKGLVNVKEGVMQGMNDAALHLQTQVKRSIAGREAEPASVDTGRLLNSVDFNTTPNSAQVFTDIEYSKFIEFGTTKFKGRHHFQNSANRSREEIGRILQRAVKININ